MGTCVHLQEIGAENEPGTGGFFSALTMYTGVFGELLAASFEFNLRPTVSGRPARVEITDQPGVMQGALVTCPFWSGNHAGIKSVRF
jgi:hypothetical protein